MSKDYFLDADFLLKIGQLYVWKGRQKGMSWKEFTISHRGWWLIEWFQTLRRPAWTYKWDLCPIVTVFGYND